MNARGFVVRNPIACSNFALSNIRGKEQAGSWNLQVRHSKIWIPYSFLFSEIDSMLLIVMPK